MTKTNSAPKTETVVLSDATIEGCVSTASKIRACLAAGATRGQVAKFLGIKYQWVRNVELTPLKRAD